MLGRAEYWLFTALWYVPPASNCSKVTRDVLWKMEKLQAMLEQEFQVAAGGGNQLNNKDE